MIDLETLGVEPDSVVALADCYYQAKCVQESYKHFGVKK